MKLTEKIADTFSIDKIMAKANNPKMVKISQTIMDKCYCTPEGDICLQNGTKVGKILRIETNGYGVGWINLAGYLKALKCPDIDINADETDDNLLTLVNYIIANSTVLDIANTDINSIYNSIVNGENPEPEYDYDGYEDYDDF